MIKSVKNLSNKDIAKILRFGGKLMELQGENPFKIKSYENAGFQIEKLDKNLTEIPVEELENINGIGKNIAVKITQILQRGSYDELDRLIEQTPDSLIELLNIKGLGAKKLRILWKELNITSADELIHACNNNKLENIKGFGKKTQDNILIALNYAIENKGKFLLSLALEAADFIKEFLLDSEIAEKIEISGDLRRKCPVIHQIDFVVLTEKPEKFYLFINEKFEIIEKDNGKIRCLSDIYNIPLVFTLCTKKEFIATLFETSGHPDHVNKIDKKYIVNAENEEAIYKKAGLTFIIPEMREGINEFDIAAQISTKNIIDLEDFKGILHTHTRYSDGRNTVTELADFVRKHSYEYLGITDHSQTAVYAGGLKPESVLKQFEEIDNYNKSFKDFKILKGIESDILRDGSLDYEEGLLKEFDFIIASIHSAFNMSREEATMRLIKAIENPYTNILGHLSGRLLLIREGYPVDHARIIDACAANKVSIELNANPQRLDIDWKWLYKAIEKNVMISINPDAHHYDQIAYIKYGVYMAKKAGIPKEFILNTLSLQEITRFFNKS